ncbi:MAG: D-tyrosyl-tRNA(Tyr) deacylase [Brockia lithotrophica]|uniref:D-aminoacyl-tRNA deacylase n=1 Tax=Brockia lithotrophica TaxID=933949 RepID=A0A2T5G760_9BACL|nr:D-tyrosyl-tRNA(Tyr) deacylase [Brockia lithotrophica]PTQ52017.1 MAG: D-tyrosyl-tRNA(Tyr) deacylase [Brockia lithotrophica]
MRVVLQRVTEASVLVDGEVVGAIGPGPGLLLFVGFTHGDGPDVLPRMADKILRLRIFADSAGKMNLSALDVGASLLVVSQFTLYADVRQGRRPSFTEALPPDAAAHLFDAFVRELRASGLVVSTGRFGAHMEVRLVNDGPVTLVLDDRELWPKGNGFGH